MKKILTIVGVAALAVTLFFNVSLSNESQIADVTLASLTKVNQANAECNQHPVWGGSEDNGHCVSLYYNPQCNIGPGAYGYNCNTRFSD